MTICCCKLPPPLCWRLAWLVCQPQVMEPADRFQCLWLAVSALLRFTQPVITAVPVPALCVQCGCGVASRPCAAVSTMNAG